MKNSSKPPVSAADIDLGIGDAANATPVALSTTNAASGTTISIEQCMREFSIPANLTPQELFADATVRINRAMHEFCAAGVTFWGAHEALNNSSPHGADSDNSLITFNTWIENNGLTKQRVYEAISVAKFYARLPEKQRRSVLETGKRNAILLASIDPEVFGAMDDGEVDDLMQMPVRELRDEIRRLRGSQMNRDAQIEILESKVKRLEGGKARLTQFTLETEDIRHEALALQADAEQPLKAIYRLFEKIVTENGEHPEYQLQVEAIWLAAHAAAANAADMLNAVKVLAETSLQQDFCLPQRAIGGALLTADEAAAWQQEYRTIQTAYLTKQDARHALRDESKPRGRGRPSNKDKAKAQ